MSVVSLGPDYLDDEVFMLMKLLARGGWMPHEVSMIERAAQRRSEEVRAGLTSYTSKYWTRRIQSEIDDRTRLRWDAKNGWTLDRWAEGRWQIVGVLGFHCVMPNLIDYLRERDMQRWPSPQAYLEYKRNLALKKQMENWAAGCQKTAAVIDRMSDKQIKEFITVEKALHTGETVTLHGASERAFDRMRKASRRSPAPPSRSINPGHHPVRFPKTKLTLTRR